MQIDIRQEAEFTDGVVAAGEVVRGILLTGDQLLRVEELTVGTLQNKKVSISGFDPPQNQRICMDQSNRSGDFDPPTTVLLHPLPVR